MLHIWYTLPMELSERIIAKLESQGYVSIDEQQYAPNSTFSPAPSVATNDIYITDGSAKVAFDGVVHELNLGEGITIPSHASYTLTAGPVGCRMVIGEKN